MTLGELIEALAKEPRDKKVAFGFHNPHSYRGYYEDLAFEPVNNITVGDMLDAATYANGKTFSGWKGGEYKMGQYSECWLAETGDCGESLGPALLAFMLGRIPEAPRGDEA